MSDKFSLGWSGRLDKQDDPLQQRFHQVVKYYHNIEDIETTKDYVVCFVGFCCDEGVKRNQGRVGAKEGPNMLRKSLANIAFYYDKEIQLLDAGNVIVEHTEMEIKQQHFASKIMYLLEKDIFPIGLGGGHEIAYATYNGLKEYNNKKDKKRIGIINFDADFDNRCYDIAPNSGTSFKQIYDDNMKEGEVFNYLVIGVQKYRNTRKLFQRADETGTQYILGDDFHRENYDAIIQKINAYMKSVDYVYMTICLDVFTSTYVHGVSAPNPLGIDPKFTMEIMKYIFTNYNVKVLDIAEMAPPYDVNNSTSRLVAQMIYNIIGYKIN